MPNSLQAYSYGNVMLNSVVCCTDGVAAAATTLPDNDVTSGTTPGDDAIPLWLPYVAITIIMLVLIAVSFARFHVVRGYQYRKRHQGAAGDSDASRKSSTATGSYPLSAAGGGGVPNGSATTVACRSGAVSGLSATPEYLTMFLEFSRDENAVDDDRKYNTSRGNGAGTQRRIATRLHSVDLTGTGNENGRVGSGRRPKRTRSADLQQTATTTTLLMTSSKRSNNANKKSSTAAAGNAKRPLAFTYNANGSMVDVRCSDDERTKTFRLLGGGAAANGNEGSGCMPLGGAITSGAPADDDESVVIVVAADDYADDYCDTVTGSSFRGDRMSAAATPRGGADWYYHNNATGDRNNYRGAPSSSSSRYKPEMTSSTVASPQAVGMMRYAAAAGSSVARSTPSDDFRSASDFRSKRI